MIVGWGLGSGALGGLGDRPIGSLVHVQQRRTVLVCEGLELSLCSEIHSLATVAPESAWTVLCDGWIDEDWWGSQLNVRSDDQGFYCDLSRGNFRMDKAAEH